MPSKGYKKKFCVRGHEIALVGRYKDGTCKECSKIVQRIDPLKDSRFTQFCPKGHDKDITGREKNGSCTQCERDRHPLKRGGQPTKFCPQGHDKDIVGRDTRGYCKKCKRVYIKKYNEQHVAQNKKYARIYFKTNKLKLQKKATIRMNKRLKIDLNYKLAVYLRNRLSKAVRNNQKKGSAVKDLGCSIVLFKIYIESKFYDNMTWNNYGIYWVIDHIIPLFKFDLTSRKQFLKAVHYTNLQPLTKKDHRKKTAKEAPEWKR